MYIRTYCITQRKHCNLSPYTHVVSQLHELSILLSRYLCTICNVHTSRLYHSVYWLNSTCIIFEGVHTINHTIIHARYSRNVWWGYSLVNHFINSGWWNKVWQMLAVAKVISGEWKSLDSFGLVNTCLVTKFATKLSRYMVLPVPIVKTRITDFLMLVAHYCH